MPTAKKKPAVKLPQDHRPTNAAMREALNRPTTFAFDGEDWTVTPADATGLEFLEALEDEQIIAALRILLGPEQAARLFKGRRVEDLEGFFEAMGEVAEVGNP